MRRLCATFASITLASIVALSTGNHADAGGGCPYYEILVARQGQPGVPGALVCHVGAVVGWLGATPGAAVSSQPPQGNLLDGYTVSILLQQPLHTEGFRPLFTETVYPLAVGGPVAFVRSRTIFQGFTAYPRWVIPAGWRTLNPTEPVPPVLKALGMPQAQLAPSSNGGSSRTNPPSLSSVTGAEARRPTPDLITLAFLLIATATAASIVRRGVARSRKDAQERDATETRVGPGDV
jgi:hypothetical protein